MDPAAQYESLPQRLTDSSNLLRTPSRRQQFTDHELNPLLSNLSPSSTLEALAATERVTPTRRHRQSFIQRSVANASKSERAWGIKVALAGKKIRQWFEELSGWGWPGLDVLRSENNEHYRCLSIAEAKEYEERIEAIKDDMETLEVEDLKNYVRNTHYRYTARRSSVSSSTTEFEPMDDFVAVITATIMQALPTLARLHSLLDTWSARLLVLRQSSIFLGGLEDSQRSMASAWNAIEETTGSPTATKAAGLSRRLVEDIRAVLQAQITQAGRALDNMLDLFEGGKDTLPDSWIEGMDELENDYSSWVVKAEEMARQHELDLLKQNVEIHSPHSVDQDRKTLEGKDSMPTEVVTQYPSVGQHTGDGMDQRDLKEDAPAQSGAQDPDLGPGTHELRSLHSSPSHVLDPTAMEDRTARTNPDSASTGGDDISPSTRTGHKPPPLVLGNRFPSLDSTVSSDLVSDASRAESVVSNYSSNTSSPEIRNASVVEFVGTPALITSPWPSKEDTNISELPSRRWSAQTERGEPGTLQLGPEPGRISPTSQRSRASTVIHAPSMKKDDTGPTLEPAISLSTQRDRARSASMQSFEVVPKHEIRQIQVRRSGSYSSSPSMATSSHFEGTSTSNAVTPPTEPDSNFPDLAPDVHAITTPGDQVVKPQAPSAKPSALEPSDAHPQTAMNHKKVPQSRAPHRFEEFADLGPGLTPVKIRHKPNLTKGNPQGNPVTQSSQPQDAMNVEDRLEARISSILTTLPTNIRLVSGLEANSDASQASTSPKTPPRSSKFRLRRAQTSQTTPTLTLAPADPKSTKSSSMTNEPATKIYHLHQPGKDVPIKLHVRLVGEAGERVMVRIGGGWADLAEYLKEYASHHGRRSVSDTRFDIQGLPSSSPSQPNNASPNSRPSSSRSNPIAPLFRRQQTTPGKFDSSQTTTPMSESPQIRIDTGATDEEASPSLGLAGPKTKNLDISPRKQAWVDDLMEQAKGGNGSGVGEMGKVGGIKRVFLKGRSRRGSNA